MDADNGDAGVNAAEAPSTSSPLHAMPADQAAATGEEGETVLYEAEGTLFQFDDQDTKTWREKGRGELRVNKAPSGMISLNDSETRIIVAPICWVSAQAACYVCSKTHHL